MSKNKHNIDKQADSGSRSCAGDYYLWRASSIRRNKLEYRKKVILDTISDAITDFLYYERKEDETLGIGEIEDAIAIGEITVDEICKEFESEIRKSLENQSESR